jgi:hypothetical protein
VALEHLARRLRHAAFVRGRNVAMIEEEAELQQGEKKCET